MHDTRRAPQTDRSAGLWPLAERNGSPPADPTTPSIANHEDIVHEPVSIEVDEFGDIHSAHRDDQESPLATLVDPVAAE